MISSYRDKEVTAETAGLEMGVRYILEAGVKRTGQHIHLTVQLTDTVSQQVIWAGNYDQALEGQLIKQDLDSGKVPFYEYEYSTGHVLHSGHEPECEAKRTGQHDLRRRGVSAKQPGDFACEHSDDPLSFSPWPALLLVDSLHPIPKRIKCRGFLLLSIHTSAIRACRDWASPWIDTSVYLTRTSFDPLPIFIPTSGSA